MKTEVKKKKDFDAVELQHRIRTELSKELSGLTPEQEIQLFKDAGERARKRRAKR